jgi:hypothetical protein
MTANQLHILRHSLGLDVLALVRDGLMIKSETLKHNEVYCVTASGKLAAVPPRTRSQQRCKIME